MKLGNYFLGAIFVALFVYVGGLTAFFMYTKGGKDSGDTANKTTYVSYVKTNQEVLAAEDSKPEIGPKAIELPQSHKMVVIPRKQIYNLSCEFAAATTILYHYTADIVFAKENAKEAEQLLMKEVGVSDNPNLGIRMGPQKPGDDEQLYISLNHGFGGSEYYGVHAPPFLDAFSKYNLKAKPLLKNDNIIQDIQHALYSGHLIMAWLRIGYGGKVDLTFTYGTVPVVKGEHVVVIHGYDKNGVHIMDPGKGGFSYLSYQDLLNASSFFTLPFLEVYQVTDTTATVEETIPLDKTTGLLRENLDVIIENATKKIGEGTQLAEILREFGYHVVDVKSNPQSELSGIHIRLKKDLSDYSYILKKDLSVSQYYVASVSADLKADLMASDSADAVIVVGD